MILYTSAMNGSSLFFHVNLIYRFPFPFFSFCFIGFLGLSTPWSLFIEGGLFFSLSFLFFYRVSSSIEKGVKLEYLWFRWISICPSSAEFALPGRLYPLFL